jgi:hypothetical protein
MRFVERAFVPARRLSGVKSDADDAELLRGLWVRHGDRLRPLQPDTVETYSLAAGAVVTGHSHSPVCFHPSLDALGRAVLQRL